MENIVLILADSSQIVVPLENIKDLVTTYSYMRDKCYEFKLFIKVSAEEEEIIKKCTCRYVGFEYEEEIEAIKVPFKMENNMNVYEKVWNTEDGWLGIQFKPNKEGK